MLSGVTADLKSKIGNEIKTIWGVCIVLRLDTINGKEVVYLEESGEEFFCDLDGFEYS